MRSARWYLGITLIAATAACGDDTSQGTGGAGTTATGTGGAGGNATTSTTSGTAGAGGGVGGGSSVCDALPPAPIDAVEVLTGLNGSEDFAFDGKGHIAARQGNAIVLVDAAQQVTPLAQVTGTTWGLRYRPDGFLVVARPNTDTVDQISPAGQVTSIVTNLTDPNGLYPDFDGNVWMTEISGNRVSRINPDNSVDVIVSGAGAQSPNGIVFDAARMLLFYTNYGNGDIRSVDMAAGGTPTPVTVTTIEGAPDGLVLDECGNLYAVDNGDGELYRVRLDAGGAAIGGPELLASFPLSVANAQFGSGAGFDTKTLYVGGTGGSFYALAVGVAGAPVPTPP